jgi:hypothetical protein
MAYYARDSRILTILTPNARSGLAREAPVDASQVRRRVLTAMARARQRARDRVQAVADAERAYASLLHDLAAPLAHQVASVLRAEGYPCTVSTPGHSVRLSLDRSRDDFVELSLDTEGERPAVSVHVRRTRGSRTIDEARPMGADKALDTLGEDDVLDALLEAVERWVER